MNAKLPYKQREFGLWIFFLFVVFLVLLISVIEFLSITETSNFGRDFGIYARFFYFTTPYVLGWVFFISAIAFFVVDQKRKQSTKFPMIMGLIACLVSTSYYSTFPSEFIQSIWLGSVLLLSTTFLFQILPGIINKNACKNLKMVVLLLSVLAVIGSLLLRFNFQRFAQIFPESVIILWSGILLGLALIYGFIHIMRIKISNQLQMEGISAIGFVLGWAPFCVLLFQMLSKSMSPITPWIFIPIALYPILIGGLIKFEEGKTKVKSGFSDNNRLIVVLIIYSLIGAIVLGANIFDRLRQVVFLQPPLFIGLIMFLLPNIISLLLMKNHKLSARKTSFIEDKRTFKSLDENIKVDHLGENEDIYEELRQKINKLTDVNTYHHFVFEPSNNEYYGFPFLSGKTSDLRFSSDSDFVQYFVKNRSAIILSDLNQLPTEISYEKEKLELLAANVIMPMYLENELAGWLAFTIDNPNPDEIGQIIAKIKPLIDQFSNAKMHKYHQLELEQRISDMNILNRIVQGVNYTLALDDIFELIYAQTTQVIPASDFYIILKDHQTQSLRTVFFVELDERISEKENHLLTQTQSMESMVIESGRGLIINNYIEYCSSRNYPVSYSELKEVMIVPLNTGAITNGCIIIGERRPDKKFSQSQLTLAQSIADLVAGAIEKARLLEETEQYARQLSILNDLTRKLTSTLEIEELYGTILQNSMDMVKCDEARLIILDDRNQELVYQAVMGSNSDKLLSTSFPLDYGLIGKSFLSKTPILANSTDSENKFHEELNAFYETSINSLMIIPMILKNQILGLIELVSHQDGISFKNNDQELISALAAQAAIALENARLYRRTDQELAKRVEELSVMQRIDRDLNTSLDMKKAMEITLTWAIRQSGCDVGWIGLISESKIQLMASSGFKPDQLTKLENQSAFSDFLKTETDSKKIQPIQVMANGTTQLHPKAITQILLPIRRNEKIIAMMMLENFDDRYLDENELNFLIRLCEHASIAIVNSQLYAEVQEANQAKSEFVSLVAHELKNPMTSIKGYTELLATGAVGSITPAQANFLSTIRNNTDRMNTLVSDLNDLTKIEAGNMRMEPKALDLKEILNELVRSTKRQLDEKQQTLHLTLDEELSDVWADPNRLLQILTNLISNAYKYTQNSGEISLIAEKSKDYWGSDPSRWVTHIMVKDNGLGISEEDQKMIFQKFFRSEDADIRASSGTGLGLNITRSLVEMQGGRIWFDSKYKKGTTFHFTLPMAE
ncbi:MAG: GAF domain-containing protein [Anaerolineaceae bacterium]|nr:GAF domain-containing protein [Anaerolineaceae bacterium]